MWERAKERETEKIAHVCVMNIYIRIDNINITQKIG